MSIKKNQLTKTRLHSRNKNQKPYDLNALTTVNPELKSYVKPNKFGVNSIDFSNPVAVKTLNKAILNYYYKIENWKFPDKNLCPPIPGRADYIHYIADLLGENNFDIIPSGDKITCLDIGTGATCIYPIIGVQEYNWKFVGSDISEKSLASTQNIINSNSSLKNKIECRLQKHKENIFIGVINKEDKFDITICNPPFHTSIEDAQKGTRRKIKNLSGKKVNIPELNFAGISNELIYDGGEYQFIQNMVKESEKFSNQCYWFSSLVSKQDNLSKIYKALEKTKASQVKTISLGTGNKSSRIVAWTFLSKSEQKEWRNSRWQKD